MQCVAFCLKSNCNCTMIAGPHALLIFNLFKLFSTSQTSKTTILEENSDYKFDCKPSKYLEVSALSLCESRYIIEKFLVNALTISLSSERPLMLTENELRLENRLFNFFPKFIHVLFRRNATHCISLYAIVMCVCVCVCVCVCRVCGPQENGLR